MKKLITIFLYFFILYKTFAQCNCEQIQRDDNTTITQCTTLPVSSNNNTQVGISISTNQLEYYLGLIIRFRDNAKNVNSSITIRLEDNNMFTLK